MSNKMNEKKYEMLFDDICEFTDGTVTYRIKALKNIPRYNVKVGDLGGYIESEHNLSHLGSCWVGNDAAVMFKAIVCEDAYIYGDAIITGDARIYGSATVYDSAYIAGHVNVYDNARIHKEAEILAYAKIYNNAEIDGKVFIQGHAEIYGNAVIRNGGLITGFTRINDDAVVNDFLRIIDNVHIYEHAVIDGHRVICEGSAEIHGNVILAKYAQVGGCADITGPAYIRCYDDCSMVGMPVSGANVLTFYRTINPEHIGVTFDGRYYDADEFTKVSNHYKPLYERAKLYAKTQILEIGENNYV